MTENKDVYNEVCVFLKKYIIEFVNSTFEEEKINIRSEYFYQTKSKKRKTVNKLLANKIQLYNQTYTEKTLSFIENTSELINYELIFHKKKLEADIVRHKLAENVEGKLLDSYFQTPSKKKKYIYDFFIFVAEKIKHLENINFLISERDNLNNDVKKEETLIDYSQSKLTEKILALNEVGVLDFLRNKEPFNFSVNKLAEFLSLCLGEKATSIQSYINAIINKSDQSKSPYHTIKTVEKVKQKLIQIGLKID